MTDGGPGAIGTAGPWPRPERRVLDGRWCRLEPLDPARHAADLWEAVSGPEAERLHRFLPEAPPRGRAELDSWARRASGSADPMFLAVIDAASGRAVGRQAIMSVMPEHGDAEIGHILWGPRLAGTAAATEAVFLVAREMLGRLGYRRLTWKCDAANAASRRAAERFGFSPEGVFRQHRVVKGRNRDTAWFSILDREWPTLRRDFEDWLAPANFDAARRQLRRLGERSGRRRGPGQRPA